MQIPAGLADILSQKLGSNVVSAQVLGGGCINQAAALKLSNSEEFFVKWNNSAPEGFFEAEAVGLKELSKSQALRIPEVVCYSEPDNTRAPAYLVLELLRAGGASKENERQLGRQLAYQHRISNEAFGFSTSNFIGTLVQSNTYTSTWGEFFFNERLKKQAELGMKNGCFDDGFEGLLLSRKEMICELLNACEEKPALLHGDLWSGNVFWSDRGPALIDPAVYYGNREADIAFTELFGRFGDDFYKAYNEEYPLSSGYERRKNILNLYHLMTHSNLFGGSYIGSARSVLSSIVSV